MKKITVTLIIGFAIVAILLFGIMTRDYCKGCGNPVYYGIVFGPECSYYVYGCEW